MDLAMDLQLMVIIGTKTIKALEDAINSVPILDLVVKIV